MTPDEHGTYAAYRGGCRCVRCKAAAADYRRDLRGRRARGLPVLGSIVSAVEAGRIVRQLHGEGFTRARIARELGHKHPILQLHRGRGAKATMRTILRYRQLRDRFLNDDTTTEDDSTGGGAFAISA